MKKYMSLKIVAEFAGVSRGTVLAWILSNKLEAVKLPSGHHRVSKEQYNEFAKKYNMPKMEN